MNDLLFLTCPPRVVKPLVEELTEYLETAQSTAHILKYGVLCKNRDGFVILTSSSPEGFPTYLYDRVRQDEEITGYVTLTSTEMEGHQNDHL